MARAIPSRSGEEQINDSAGRTVVVLHYALRADLLSLAPAYVRICSRQPDGSEHRAEKSANAGGESHCKRAPERDSDCGAQNICTTRYSPDRSEKSEKAQRGSGHDRHKRSGGRYDNHEQRQGCTCRKHGRRCQCGLYRTRGSDRRNSKLIARVGGQGIFRHQLLGNPPREGWIDTTLDVD